jgi:hypothetical protein
MNQSRTLKLLLAVGTGLLTVSTQATDLKIDETGGNKGDVFKFSSGDWKNVVETITSGAGTELFEFAGNLKTGKLDSQTSSIEILDPDRTVSDVLMVTVTAEKDTSGAITSDDVDVKLYSGGGWPLPLPVASVNEPTQLSKILQVGTTSDLNVFLNSPEGNTVPDGGMTLALLGSVVSVLGLIRRKLS